MSTLTKVLIVLLSLSTIFLSGTMVTFVATTDDYKEKTKTLAEKVGALTDETALHNQRLQEKDTQMAQERKVLQTTIQDLQSQLSDMAIAKRKAETERNEYEIKYTTLNGTMEAFQTTLKNETETRKLTQQKLDESLTKVIKLQSELNIIEADKAEKIVNIQRLKEKVKNLTEAKAMYEAQIAKLSDGKPPVVKEKVVTTVSDHAMEALPAATNVSLKGVVTGISANLELLTLSLGSADGVTKNAVFHVTRGDEFICNVKITEVDTNKSAGVIELQIGQPKLGDTVTNEL